MIRPLTGRRHVGERRETRPNGDDYVYERVTEYDPQTKRTKTVSTRLLGKIPAGSTEMIPTRPKLRKGGCRSAGRLLCFFVGFSRAFPGGAAPVQEPARLGG